jgi:membrane-bound metal-dependent hydrolase YbcI (DUF457 family)
MFVGHFAVGFAAKRAAPAVSLGTLFLAAQWLDLVWPTLVVAGVETVRLAPGLTAVTPLDFVSYPWSHSLAAALVWALVLGGGYALAKRRPAAGWVIGGAVFSHWILDFVTHRPDLQLWPGSETRVGLGLWYSRPATLAVELTLFALGVAVYARSTRARDRAGTIGLVALVVFLLVVYLGALFGPPPPDVKTLGWSAQAVWLLVAWGYWLDRHRRHRDTG